MTMATKKRDNTYTLLIWEMVPDSTMLALIPNEDLTSDDIDTLRAAHGHYINTDVSAVAGDALDAINNALCKNPQSLSEDHPEGSYWAMKFKDYLVDAKDPVEGKVVTRVVLCGFVL